ICPSAPPVLFLHPHTPQTYTLSLHDALPIFEQLLVLQRQQRAAAFGFCGNGDLRLVSGAGGPGPAEHQPLIRHHLLVEAADARRSEEHTSELQSRVDLVCRLLLEKKKNTKSQ